MADNLTPVSLSVKDFETREVMMIDYKFDQTVDREGQISGIPRGGRITIRVKASTAATGCYRRSLLSPNDPRDLKVTFFNTIDGSTMKELEGTACYCVHYIEKWEDGEEHFEELEIVCQELKNGPVAFQNPWK